MVICKKAIVLFIAFSAFLLFLFASIWADEIHDAARKGDLAKVKELLEKDPKLVNAKDERESTPLHFAASRGHKEIVELLVAKGADVNAKNDMGYSPLDWAMEYGKTEIIQLLKSKGAQQTPVQNPDVFPLSESVSRIVFPYHMHTNIGASIGPDGILLIDTGFSKQCVDKLRAKLKEIGNGDIKYIINTHHHGDHTAGNSIGNDRTILIRYQDLDQMLSEGVIVKGKEPIKGRTGKTFETYYIMQFNGEEIRIIPYPGVHSDTDLIIYFTEPKVVHMGDLLLSQSFPAVGRNVVEYMELLEKVLDIFPADTTFISGHGRDSTFEDVKDYQKMLLTTIEIVKKGMKKGKSINDLQKEKVLKDYEVWGTFLTFLDTNYWIGAIYRSYEDKM